MTSDEIRPASVWPPAPAQPTLDPTLLPPHEFRIEALPYSVRNTHLSDFRSGTAVLRGTALRITGRASLPESRRRLIYTLSGLAFLPGVFLAYVLMERAPWSAVLLDLNEDNIKLIAKRDDYRLISIMYEEPDENGGAGNAMTLTFQVDRRFYKTLIEQLDLRFPGKIRNERLQPRLAPGTSLAWVGVCLWAIGLMILAAEHRL